MVVKILLGVLILMVIPFAYIFAKDVIAHKNEPKEKPHWFSGLVGLVANFLDTLGIGSFAQITAIFKATKAVDDKVIPGTLNVANAIPIALQALIFITVVKVEVVTLVTLIASATVGAWLGAGIVAKFSRRMIRLVMGIALACTAILMTLSIAGLIEGHGSTTGLTGGFLIVGIIGNFFLGAFMTAGVGLYAPCMAMLFLLGMSPLCVFPIMMGSCAFLMPVAGIKFIKTGKYARKPSVAITITGAIGVLIAAYLITSLPLNILKIVVIVVVIYTSGAMLYSANQEKKQ
ncbi:MAG: sulfite exporter TauE/SafE family protein [Bacteroidales bacterium]|nr:sulfite exporter TauE/SafE family protein [Bacteroidales bacterium]